MRWFAAVLAVLISGAAGVIVGLTIARRDDGMPDAARKLCATFMQLNTQAWREADVWTREHPDAAHPATPPDVWTIGKQAELERAVREVSIETMRREWRAIPIAVSNLSSTMAMALNSGAEPVSRVDQQDRFNAAEAACTGRA